ncbi:MAG: hypothetical protein HDQ97_19425 [Lachnospiraceae bacterium]|nr:hypothetical protein [Lachnospiraceae bacterium]
MIVFVILLIFILLCILFLYYVRSLNSKPKTDAPHPNSGSFHGSSMFKLIDGIDGWGKGILIIKAELWDDGIMFHQSAIGDSPHITLLYDQITSTSVYTEEEIIEKSKSVLGRAAAGAVFFGPLGAIIGGMSGTGSTSTSKTNFYYTINYVKSDSTPGMITLGTSCSGCNWSKFDNLLKPFIPQKNNPEYL